MITEPVAFADGRSLGDSGLDSAILLHPTADEFVNVWVDDLDGAARMAVDILGGDSSVIRSWRAEQQLDPERGEYVANPHVAFVDDGFWVIWHSGSVRDAPNPVYARKMGCVDGG